MYLRNTRTEETANGIYQWGRSLGALTPDRLQNKKWGLLIAVSDQRAPINSRRRRENEKDKENEKDREAADFATGS